jgi:hypothetical protein
MYINHHGQILGFLLAQWLGQVTMQFQAVARPDLERLHHGQGFRFYPFGT